MFALDNEECQQTDKLFPLHAEFLRSRHEKPFQTQKSLALNDPGDDRQKINGLLHQMAWKRMSTRQHLATTMKSAWLSEGKLRIGDVKNLYCHTVSSHPHRRGTCINCKLGAAKDRPHLVEYVSPYISTIMTDNNNQHKCPRCQTLQVLEPESCLESVKNHVVDMEIHHLPPTSQHTIMHRGTCIIANHLPSYRQRCSLCMTKALVRKVKAQQITDHWLLFDISATESNGLLAKVLDCHKLRKCLRIQNVPGLFCSAHRAFLRPASPQSEPLSKKPSVIHRFTRSYIPVGIWPPKNQAIITHMKPMADCPSHATRDEFQCNAGLWTTYNSVALVGFDTEYLKQVSCVVCLIQHSEVFFVFFSEDKSSGYVWMRQAPSKVLQMCLKEHCKSLSHDEKRNQIERPDGLRPWTSFDILGRL